MNLTEVERAIVRKAGHVAATLTRDSDGVTFAYVDGYAGPPVATTLPVDAPPVVTQPGQLPAFFTGLLPEGRRLTALRQSVKTSVDDEFSLLLAVGGNTVGDVTVLPDGTDPTPIPALISGDEINFAKLRERTGLVERTGLAGAQDKASGAMMSLPVKLGGTDAIVKLDPPEYPLATINEHFFLKLARGLRQPVAHSELITDVNGETGLVVRRFDRAPEPLAVEDACQLAGRYPADKYRMTAADVINVVAEVCPARLVAMQAVFQQFVFAWLTGNGDLHAKNVSVLQTHDGEWRVAPIYDIPSTLPYGDRTSALAVAGARENLTRRTFLRLADEVGLPERAASRAIDEALRATQSCIDSVSAGTLPYSAHVVRQWTRQLRRRRTDLAG